MPPPMAFSDEEGPRRRKRSRADTGPKEAPWPRKDEPLSWAMLPPEEEDEEEDGGASVTPVVMGGPVAPVAAERPATAPEVADEWKSRYQYLLADFENFRRRVAKETEGAVAATRAKLLLKVIALHEGIEGALGAVPAEAKPLRDGLGLVLHNFDLLLKEEGVEPVAKLGEKFQPEVHEAVGQLPVSASAPEGSIGAIVQQGYRGPGGLLRPAKVLVASTKSSSAGKT